MSIEQNTAAEKVLARARYDLKDALSKIADAQRTIDQHKERAQYLRSLLQDVDADESSASAGVGTLPLLYAKDGRYKGKKTGEVVTDILNGGIRMKTADIAKRAFEGDYHASQETARNNIGAYLSRAFHAGDVGKTEKGEYFLKRSAEDKKESDNG